MGHKKPARANRVGVWVQRERDPEPRMAAPFESVWYAPFASDVYQQNLREDWLVRQAVDKQLGTKVGISKVRIDRKSDRLTVYLHALRPANVTGRDNSRLETLNQAIRKALGDERKVKVNVIEADPTDPHLIAERIAIDLERRIAFRKACKGALTKAMSSPDVIGIKVIVSGRLSGAEIARTEWYLEGKVPLHTLYANIDNGFAQAETTYGIIGVKVTIHRNLQRSEKRAERSERPDRPDRPDRRSRAPRDRQSPAPATGGTGPTNA